MKKKITGWCRLLRLPNLFTVPGDAALGFVIAGGLISSYNFAYSIISVLSLYMFGLITNDLADISEDKIKRPERPLPSGAVSVKSAKIAALILLFVSLYAASVITYRTFYIAGILAVLITLYNFLLKKNSIAGPFAVAVCRMLSLSLGYYAAGTMNFFCPMIIVVFFIWLLYFFGVSLAAYYEADSEKNVRGVFFLFIIPFLWIVTAPFASGAVQTVVIMKEINPSFFLAVASTLIFSFFVIKNSIMLTLQKKTNSATSKYVGELILSVMFLQAAGCAFAGYPYLALAIFLLFVPARITAKRFYSS